MNILLATSNPHKLDEIKNVFDGESVAGGINWMLFSDLEAHLQYGMKEPVEDQDTFEGNAALKARHYAKFSQQICVADDSGIEVDALGGAPGVISARYSGVRGPRNEVDPANNIKLLEELAGVPVEERSARFVCVMCLVVPDFLRGQLPGGAYAHINTPGDDVGQLIVRGTVEGRILLPEEADDPARPEAGRGDNGFGYDPLFVLPEGHCFAGQTTAQLTPQDKNAISHRGAASRLLLVEMQQQGVLG